MRRLITTTLLPLAVAGSSTLARAEAEPRLWRSAYYLGRGDTGIAIADDEEAIFYNPAGLAQGKGIYKKTVLASPHVEMSQSTKDAARRMGAEDADAVDTVANLIGEPNHAGIYNFTGLILRRAAVGAFVSSNLDLLAYKSPDAGGLEMIEASADENVGLTFSLADGFFNNKLLVGVTGKYMQRGRGYASAGIADADQLQEQLDDQEQFMGQGEGGGADVGMQYHTDSRVPLSFGLSISDVGDTKITPAEATDLDLDVKQTINAGVAIEPGTKYSKLRLLADYRDIAGRAETNPRKKLHLGGELAVLNLVGLTGGINQGYGTVGFYFDFYILRLDAGMYTEEVGERVGTRPDTRYFMRLRAGF